MTKKLRVASVPVEHIAQAILTLRERRVLLDADLAVLYGVPTKALNQAVKRNSELFPEDFVFRLTRAENESLNRSQIVTGSKRHRDPRFPPYVFTEHGAIMAATVLKSPRAVETSVYIVRAFVKLREMLAANETLIQKLNELEHKLQSHDRQSVACERHRDLRSGKNRGCCGPHRDDDASALDTARYLPRNSSTFSYSSIRLPSAYTP